MTRKMKNELSDLAVSCGERFGEGLERGQTVKEES